MTHLVLNSELGSRVRILELFSVDFNFSQGFTKFILNLPNHRIQICLHPTPLSSVYLFYDMTTQTLTLPPSLSKLLTWLLHLQAEQTSQIRPSQNFWFPTNNIQFINKSYLSPSKLYLKSIRTLLHLHCHPLKVALSSHSIIALTSYLISLAPFGGKNSATLAPIS